MKLLAAVGSFVLNLLGLAIGIVAVLCLVNVVFGWWS